MNYKLCSKILSKASCTDDVRELIYQYIAAVDTVRVLTENLSSERKYIQILEAENRFLKEKI